MDVAFVVCQVVQISLYRVAKQIRTSFSKLNLIVIIFFPVDVNLFTPRKMQELLSPMRDNKMQ